MFQRFWSFVFALCCLTLHIRAQDIQGPQSPADLDGEIKKIGASINQRLSGLGGGNQPARVLTGSFFFEGVETSLGSYWTQNLVSELSNMPDRGYSVILSPGPSPADYTVTGEISDLVSTVRIYTRIVTGRDSQVIVSWHTDLGKTAFLEELLDTGSSSSGARVPRDRFETDSRENPLAAEIGDFWIDRTIHNSNDEDWFLIVPAAGGLLGMETSGDMDTYMELYDDSGSELEEDDDGGNSSNAFIEYFAEAGARYILKIRGYSGSTGRYRFRVTLTDIDVNLMEPNDTRETASAITPEEPAAAFFHSAADVDWYRVDIPAGGAQLTAYTEGRIDTLLTLYDNGGNEIAADDDSGDDYNARLSAFVPDGPAYIKADKYDGGRGIYTLFVRLREPVGLDEFEPDNTRQQAKEIAPGSPQRRSFSDEDDADWASFRVTEAGYYVIQARGEDTNGLDTYIELFDQDGELIDEDDDGGEEYSARLRIRLDSGTYFIKVHTLDDGPIEEHYILSLDRA
jgi:hypothetical protein